MLVHSWILSQAAGHFTASLDMVWYRYRINGLPRQLGRRGW